MSTYPILEITDGTTSISLLAQVEGFFHLEWEPAVAQFKDDGVFADNPIAEGRNLVMGVYGNAVEEIVVRARANSPDRLSEIVSDLRQLLAKGNSYWVSDLDTDLPTYMKVRAKGETNTRYAVIKYATLTGDPNPFSQPFMQVDGSAVAANYTLSIERGHWMDSAPFQDTEIGSTAVTSPDFSVGGIGGGDIGNVDSTGSRSKAYDAFFSNKFIDTNIGSAYYHPSGGSVDSDNRQDNSLPITYMPSTIAGSILYLGSELPFNSVVFPQEALSSGTTTATLEYWNGSAWAAPGNIGELAVAGATSVTFDTDATAKGFSFEQPEGWSTANLQTVSGDGTAPSVTAYWVKIELTSALPSGGLVCNERIYAVNWPFVEVTTSDIPGNDLTALTRQVITPYFSDSSLQVLKMMFCVVDDNALNQPFINFSNDTNANIFTSIVLGTDVSYSSTIVSAGDGSALPCGEAALFSPSGTTSAFTDRVTARVSGQTKVGRFRAFARVVLENNSDDPTLEHTLRLQVNSYPEGRTIFTGDPIKIPDGRFDLGGGSDIRETSLLDFGFIDTRLVRGRPLELSSNDDANYAAMDFVIQTKNPSAAVTDIAFIDLVLMPIDMIGVEMTGYITAYQDAILIDCSRDPKDLMKSYVLKVSTDGLENPALTASGSDTVALEPFRNYRAYFFIMHRYSTFTLPPYVGDEVCKHEMYATGRYLSYRGDL